MIVRYSKIAMRPATMASDVKNNARDNETRPERLKRRREQDILRKLIKKTTSKVDEHKT